MTPPETISVVIPVLNDAVPLRHLLTQLQTMPHVVEVFVVDGGSEDGGKSATEELGGKWMEGPPGRGPQLNLGAGESTGDVLWFLHADTTLSERSSEAILDTLRNPECVGGAFRFRLSNTRWYGPLFHFSVNLRSRVFKLPFGDQGLFVRRDLFEEMGGFRLSPILEDLDFVLRLRRKGELRIVPVSIGVSARRWDREGVLRRTVLNWIILFGFFFGVSPEKLVRFYRPEQGR